MAAPPTDSGALLSSDPSAPSSSATVPFRAIVPGPAHPKIAGISTHTAQSWASSREAIPAAAWLMDRLRAAKLEKPFVGLTTDGTVRTDVYPLPADRDGDWATTSAMAEAAEGLLSLLTETQRAAAVHASVEQDEFRLWSNPELYVNPGGVRLDEASPAVRAAVHALLRASFSSEGYAKVWGCCLTNGFLGELVDGRGVLNEHSYNFRLFGSKFAGAGGATAAAGGGATATATATATPAPPPNGASRLRASDAWGYTFFGHHLCVAVAALGPHIVIGPTFLGAEPDRVDAGPHAGLRLFADEEHLGLALQRSLPPELQARAQVAGELKPGDSRGGGASGGSEAAAEPLGSEVTRPRGSEAPAKPLSPDRWNPFDERHLGGARQDNRVVPYEGLRVADMPPGAREELVRIWRAFNGYYPAALLAAREREMRRFLESDTYWAWIGGWDETDAFYYRIHGPTVFCELDFHCGIFLTNTQPARCHIHTINRLPNAGDYGTALLAEIKRTEGGA